MEHLTRPFDPSGAAPMPGAAIEAPNTIGDGRMTREEARKAPCLFTRTAWDSIGWDHGYFRVKGGRTIYEAVQYNCATGGRMVLLSRLEWGNSGAKQIDRYVEPDTVLEFLEGEPLNV